MGQNKREMNFPGYRRQDGKTGVRNYVLLVPTVVCSSEVCRSIARKVRGVVAIDHPHGCAQVARDAEQTMRTLVGMGKNPNVAAVLVVGLGCELVEATSVAAQIAESGKWVESLVIQEIGGTPKTIQKGVAIARKMLSRASLAKRESVPVSSLVLGVECGGSDACSGLSANPALGVASDLLVGKGGTVILSETTEMIGAEHLLARRAVDRKIRKKLLDMVKRTEVRGLHAGEDIRGANPAPGNIKGGITTLEEKSLGCVLKGGSAPIVEVLEYAELPTRGGLVLMDTPGQDAESVTGLLAGGAQVIAFTTGRGSPLGSPIAPVIKIASNSFMFSKMRDNMDINAGGIVSGRTSIEEAGEKIFREILRVASGKQTKSERLGHREFAINRIGPTF